MFFPPVLGESDDEAEQQKEDDDAENVTFAAVVQDPAEVIFPREHGREHLLAGKVAGCHY